MPNSRRHPRTGSTEDLSATLRPAGRASVVGDVLNISQGGMLVGAGDLEVGETAGFEIIGPDFRLAGLATVAHCTEDATGLRFLSWQGPAHRTIRGLVQERLLTRPLTARRA